MYATTLCASAQAQEKWYLKDESVACLSEELYSTQLKYVTQGVNELIKGCIITTKEYQVILVESHVFSPSKVILVENKLTMWTDFNSLTSK
jgi:hypothetical protein